MLHQESIQIKTNKDNTNISIKSSDETELIGSFCHRHLIYSYQTTLIYGRSSYRNSLELLQNLFLRDFICTLIASIILYFNKVTKWNIFYCFEHCSTWGRGRWKLFLHLFCLLLIFSLLVLSNASNVQCCSKILLTEIIVQRTHSDDKCTIVPILKDTERNIRNRRSETDEYLSWR